MARLCMHAWMHSCESELKCHLLCVHDTTVFLPAGRALRGIRR